MKYRIIDLQGAGLKERYVFESKAEIIENLADFHDMDWSDEVYPSIYDLLNKIETEQEKLDFLCEHGQWEVVECEGCICDKCKKDFDTFSLVWLTTEDFTPKQGEVLSEEADKYDAVCERCYQTLLVKLIKCQKCGIEIEKNNSIETADGQVLCESCETKRTIIN